MKVLTPRLTLVIILLISFLITGPITAQSLKSPEDEFGFKMGTDKKLIDWTQVTNYFLNLGKHSSKIIVRELGKTTLGKPFLLSIISSEDNIKNLERYKRIQHQLANPYELSDDKADMLIEEGKIVVIVTLNIHSTEIGASQESVELAYDLVTRTDRKIAKILDNVIILLVPSLNPDGLQMVVDWYKQHVGTLYEGSSMPWLYHHYAGHDNNRDWYMFNLAESRHTAGVLYHEWFPEIVLDQHQMGSTGPRLFMPPYADPVNPNVHATVMAEVNMLGKNVVADLHAQGFKGVITGLRFNAFFEGTMSKTPLWHNMVGILTEMASARVASPIYLPRGSLGPYGAEISKYSRVTDFLSPWEGGWWRLRDIIDYEKALTFSILDLAATYKKRFLKNFYSMNKTSINQGKTEPPYAFIIPLDQHDPNSASEMLKRIEINGGKIYKSKTSFVYDGRTYAAGTFIIPLSQPCRPFIKDLLEPQLYPNLEQYPDGPPLPPYDVTGWTLWLQMGVKLLEMNTPMDMDIVLTDSYDFTFPETLNASAKTFLFERRFNHSFVLMNQLLQDGIEVYWTDEASLIGDTNYPAGTFLVPSVKGVSAKIDALANQWQVPVKSLKDELAGLKVKTSKARLPRLALYQPWTTSMDEGWTRLVLDNFRFKYTSLHNEEIKKGNLNAKYDVIILPDMSTETITDGIYRWWYSGEPRIGDAEEPPQYKGGIGSAGVKALKAFALSGGTLITLGNASNFAIEKIRVPAVNVLKNVKDKDYYAPGSLLRLHLDTSNPLAYGMREKTAVRVTNSPAFRLLMHVQESYAAGYFDQENPLLSGWLIGAEKLAGRTALAEIKTGKGKVIMYGFRVQSRAQTYGTFKLLFNGIYH